MKFRTTVATTLAAAAAVLSLGAAPAIAATPAAAPHHVSAAAHHRVTVHSWMTKPYKSVHGTYLYKANHAFYVYATFSPNETGHLATAELQMFYKGQWRNITLDNAHPYIERGSRTWIGWKNGIKPVAAGYKFRVAITYPGSNVTWHTFEIVK